MNEARFSVACAEFSNHVRPDRGIRRVTASTGNPGLRYVIEVSVPATLHASEGLRPRNGGLR